VNRAREPVASPQGRDAQRGLGKSSSERARLNRDSLERAVGLDRKAIGHSRHEIGYVE
jgi:hypothetical protein